MTSPVVGLKVLWEGQKTHKMVDIVAVHGVSANPDRTWSKWNGKIDRNWLKDDDMLPRAVPHARILRFAYESQWLGEKMISQSLQTVATTLLQSLKEMRQHCPRRPIIFVGHCFGGIVIEKALTSAKQLSEYHSIIDRVAGVIFIATPHKGTKSQSTAAVIADIATYAGVGQRSHLVDTLEPHSEFLDDIVSHFSRLANDIRIPLCCFFEQRETDVSAILRSFKLPFVPSFKVLVVDEHSASLDSANKIGIGLDHFQINKFSDPNDGYYKLVQYQVQTMVDNAYECVQSRILKSETTFHVSKAQNSNFTGRGNILEDLEEIIDGEEEGQKRAALYGLGGVGKTSIAVRLAHSVKNRCSVFWTEGSSQELFKTSFLSVAEKVDVLTGAANADELVLRNWLDSEKSGPWLLIVDGVESAEDIQKFLPTNRGAILFTTSDRTVAENLVDEGQEINVPSMTPEEAKSLFLKLTPSSSTTQTGDVMDLVALLGCLPLAIVQACAYIKLNSMSVHKYGQQLRQRMEAHSSSESSLEHLLPERKEQSVLDAWDISYNLLGETNECAIKLLQVFALLSSNPIPRKVLQPDKLTPIDGSSDRFIDRALALLCALAFISVSGEDDERFYQVHSLVILWVRTKITDESIMANTAFEVILHSFPRKSQNTVQSRSEGAIILSHALSIESYYEANASVDLPKVMKLKRKIGRQFARIGSSIEAERRMRTCIKYYEEDDQESARELATCYVILGTALQAQCKFDEAISYYEKAYDLRKESLGQDHSATLDVLGDKAVTLSSQGKMEEALQSYVLTYNSIMASPDKIANSGPRLSYIMNGMALAYRNLGDTENARKWYSDGLQTAVNAHGYEHPLTWTLMTSLVDMYHKLGKHRLAKDTFFKGVDAIMQVHKAELGVTDKGASISDSCIRVFPIIRKLMGNKHSSVIGYMDYIGSRLKEEGKYEQAAKWYQEAYELSIEVFGLENLTTLDIAHNMSAVCSELGDTDKANEYAEYSLNGSIKLLGYDHPTVLKSLCRKAFSLIDDGEFSEALEVLDKVYEGQKSRLSLLHADTLSTLGAMAEAHQGLEEHDKALELYQRALDGYKAAKFGSNFEPLLDAQQNMAALFIDTGRDKEAIDILSQLVVSRQVNKTRCLYAKSMMGSAMVREGEKQGLEMAKEALDGLRECLPNTSDYVCSAIHNFAECLRLQNRLEESLVYYEEEWELSKEMMGPDDVSTLEALVEKADVLALLKRKQQAAEAYKSAQKGFEASLGLRHSTTMEIERKHAELTEEKSSPYEKLPFYAITLAVPLSLALALLVAHRKLRGKM